MYLAHVRWFTDEASSYGVANLSPLEISFVITGVVALLGLLLLLAGSKKYIRVDKKINKASKKYGPWAATLVRISLGALLVINAWNEYLWAPNITSTSGPEQYISWLLAGVGILLIMGLYVRLASLTLIVLYLSSFLFVDVLQVLEHIEYLGMALFLASSAGKLTYFKTDTYDLDHLDKYKPHALSVLCISVGLSLAILAFSEKFFGLDIAHNFLASHDWNFLDGLGVSDRLFIIIAGIFELVIGLALIFNIARKLVIGLVLVLFVLTAALLGVDEIIGHMFAVGVVAVIWLNYPDPHKK